MEPEEDSIPSGYYRPLASPKAPLTDDQDRPVSIISSSARSAKVVAAPPSPTRSINTEVYEDNPNRNVDRFNETSSEEEEGYHDLRRSGSVPLHPKHIKREQSAQSPSFGVHQSSSLNISHPIAVASSTGFETTTPEPSSTIGVQAHHEPHPSEVSIRSSSESRRFSTLEVDDGVSPKSTWTGMGDVGRAISTDLPSSTEQPIGSDRHPSISPLPSRESTIRRSFGRILLAKPPVPSTDPTYEGASAPREIGGFRLPFLHGMPKLIRPSSYAKSSLTPSEEKEVKDVAQPPGSFFNDGSSYGEPDDEDSQIDHAQQAIVGKPVMVKHGSRTRMGLKEMLHTAPLVQDRTGASRGKAIRMIGDLELGRQPMSKGKAVPVRKPSKREGVVGMPQQEEEDTLSQQQDNQVGIGIFHTLNPFADDGLGSSPVSPTHVPAAAPPPQSKRSVSFRPAPPQLGIKPEHRFLRQDIVSTPYPPGFKGRSASQYNGSERGTMPKIDEAPKSLLTLVLYSHGDSISKVKKIVIPTPPETALVDDSDEKKPPIKATLSRNFDDEKLFKLIRSEYNHMRGSLRRLASARTVRSMNLLAYRSTAELVSKQAKPMHFRHQDNDEHLAEARMLHLFEKPDLGKRHHDWVEWVATLPENSNMAPVDNERIALELVEGWSTRKFLAAVAAVLACSLTITLLWIFLGVGGDTLGFESADVSLSGGLMGKNASPIESPIGYKGAGGRVETGAALGILVLMFGWTSIGAWILLNWLVM